MFSRLMFQGVLTPLIKSRHVFCRGQESAGIVTSTGSDAYSFFQHKGMGLVSQIFKEDVLPKLKGNLGIGKLYCIFGAEPKYTKNIFVELSSVTNQLCMGPIRARSHRTIAKAMQLQMDYRTITLRCRNRNHKNGFDTHFADSDSDVGTRVRNRSRCM